MMKPAPDPDQIQTVEIQSATREPDGHPFVRLTVGNQGVILTPGQARSLAGTMVDIAATAEVEAAVCRVIATQPTYDLDPADFIRAIVEARQTLRTEASQAVH